MFAITAEDVVGISTTTFHGTAFDPSGSFFGPIVDAESNGADPISIQIIVVELLGENKNLQTQ